MKINIITNIIAWYNLVVDGLWAIDTLKTSNDIPEAVSRKTLGHFHKGPFTGTAEERREAILFLKCIYIDAMKNRLYLLGWLGWYGPADYFSETWAGFRQAVAKQNEVCSICMDEIKLTDCRVLGCMHVVHCACFRELIQKRQSKQCPMCRCDKIAIW